MRREKLFTTYLNDNQEVHYIITTVIMPPGLNKDKQIILQMHSFVRSNIKIRIITSKQNEYKNAY